jgi:class 3 adenylate cyclase/predicted ATPase
VRGIEQWLKGLGLGEYAQRFVENDVDWTILSDLTDQDLEKIGVASLGHRRKLLRAIAEMDKAADPVGKAPSALAPISVAPPFSRSAEPAGERRYLTVMFCDLVGSTSIAATLDAEEWRDLVGGYLDAASAAVTEMGGHVAKKLGDGLLALFGYPVAQENDTERAVRAALSIQRSLEELNRRNAARVKPTLSARIGLEAGSVVVDAAGEIFGDAPNVAARVHALAEPGAVLVTSRVQRQVAGLFVAEDRGSHELKGVPEPQTLFRLVRASGGGRRAGQRQLTPIVGRDEEIAVLLRRWERARQGDGQLVMVVGEPGLGKSRLIEELHARLGDTPHTWVEWSCSQLLQNTPLHPIAEWGRQRFGGAEVPADQRLADLENTLAQVRLDSAENAPLLAPLLDIPLPDARALALPPEELRRRQLAALLGWVLAGAKTQPIVLAVEDLQWADPTTIELLRSVAERGSQASLLALATARPEFRPPWGMRSHHGAISLAPLDPGQVRAMVTELSARHALADNVVNDVAARTGGVPLFVEELTRLLLEQGAQSGAHAIPPTLQQSLAARLDRLGPAREVAQIGSVIGRDFSYALLRATADIDDSALQPALERLAEADILLAQGLPPHSDYRFKHALIQDAAYESLLKSRRQLLHRRIAETLRDRFAATAEPEALAHHFTQAGLTDEAIEWWGKAGDQALRRSAFQEAISHLGKAIEMADKTSGAQASSLQKDVHSKVQLDFARAMMSSKGPAADETRGAFTRVRDLATTSGRPDERYAAYFGEFGQTFFRAEFDSALTIAQEFLRDASAQDRDTERIIAHRCVGWVCFFQGKLAEAKAHQERALVDYVLERDAEARFRFGVDGFSGVSSSLALTAWHFGEVERSRHLIESGIRHAENLQHVPSILNARGMKIILEARRDDVAAALRVGEALVGLSRAHGVVFYETLGDLYVRWARGRLSGSENAASEMRKGLSAYFAQGNKTGAPFFHGLLGQLEATNGNVDAALAEIEAGLSTADLTGERNTNSFLYRSRGDVLLKRDPADFSSAEEAYKTALAVASEQHAHSYQLLAALSLAKLYQSSGRPAEGYEVLAPGVEGLTPTPEMPEIAEAQALLDVLSEAGEVKKDLASRKRRLKLQTSLGQAMMWSRGFGSNESMTAFARARTLAEGIDNASERFDAYHGLFTGSLLRGELSLAQETAENFLREAETAARMTEASLARRHVGHARLYQGDFIEAQSNLAEALRTYDPERDHDDQSRFGVDNGATATAFLAQASWALGDVERARALGDEALARADETAHAPTRATVYHHICLYYVLRGDAEAVRRIATVLVDLSREHGMALYLAYGELYSTWARARLDDRESGISELRRSLAAYIEQGNKLHTPLFQGLLAELEAEGDSAEGALRRIDEALALANETGVRWTEALLHRIRGAILLKRDPANPAAAEKAFLTAIAVAQEQKARSLGLRAALSLAKLYQSSGRLADAHHVLAPALEGFSPTPDIPAIAEAQALLTELAEGEEVKADAARRQRRVELASAYSQALMWSKGFVSEETKAAFGRVNELVAQTGSNVGRFGVYSGEWIRSFARGEMNLARKIAELFLQAARAKGRQREVARAQVCLGATCMFQGELALARSYLEQAATEKESEEVRRLFGMDTGIGARILLALASYLLGEVEHGAKLMERSFEEAQRSNHAPTVAQTSIYKMVFEEYRNNPAATLTAAEALIELANKHGMPPYLAGASMSAYWARGRGSKPNERVTDLRQALATVLQAGSKFQAPFVYGLIADLESLAGNFDVALEAVDQGLALAEETGERWTVPLLLHRKGEVLLLHDPTNPGPAEEALKAAIEIAEQQGSRTFGLRAALSLAKLCQSTARPVEAHAVLASALEGFSPTAEMPEIEEAQGLLSALAERDEVKTDAARRQRRLQLQTGYAQAVAFSKGFLAEEAKAAFERASELAGHDSSGRERFGAYYGRWIVSLTREEIADSLVIAREFLNVADSEGRAMEAAAACRALGLSHFVAGDFGSARMRLEQAMGLHSPTHDEESRRLFGFDPQAGSMAYLAFANLVSGELVTGRELIDAAVSRADGLGHLPTRANTLLFKAIYEAMRGDPEATLAAANALVAICGPGGLSLYLICGEACVGWARARRGDLEGGTEALRRSRAKLADQGGLVFSPFFAGLLAGLEAEGGRFDAASALVEETLAKARQTGSHFSDSMLLRLRGHVLLKSNPVERAPIEEAFQLAIAIAKEQDARGYELLASLSLAKLYHSTGRLAEANAVLAPALEGFTPTPEMPEITEAQALLAALKN